MTGAAPTALSFRDGEGGRIALVTITLPGEQPLPSAHQHAGAIEEAVRERCPSLGDVIVHTEPAEAEAGLKQIDRRRGAHGEQHSGVAVVAVQDQQQSGDQADPDGHQPRDSRQGHAGILT